MLTGSLSLVDVVNEQSSLWNIVMQPLGFFIYAASAIAEVNRCPFDLPEAETELVRRFWAKMPDSKFRPLLLKEAVPVPACNADQSSSILRHSLRQVFLR